jgi:hypothetical protein
MRARLAPEPKKAWRARKRAEAEQQVSAAELEPLPDRVERPQRFPVPDHEGSDPMALRPPALGWENGAP